MAGNFSLFLMYQISLFVSYQFSLFVSSRISLFVSGSPDLHEPSACDPFAPHLFPDSIVA